MITNMPIPAHLHSSGGSVDPARERAACAEMKARSSQVDGIGPVLSEEQRRWVEENRPNIDFWNAYVEEHGIPLEEFRNF